MRSGILPALVLGAGLVLPAGGARAALTYEVTIASPALAEVAATLAFDLIDGGTPSNAVTVGPLSSNGTMGATATTGEVSGSGPWHIGDGSFFNELLVAFDPFGSSLVFRFTASDLPAENGSFPDAFSMFVLAPDLASALITTDDPTGANALFLLNLGEGPGGLTVFTPNEAGFSIAVVLIRDIPEPATAWLVACAFAGALGLRRRRTVR